MYQKKNSLEGLLRKYVQKSFFLKLTGNMFRIYSQQEVTVSVAYVPLLFFHARYLLRASNSKQLSQ